MENNVYNAEKTLMEPQTDKTTIPMKKNTSNPTKNLW